MIETRASLQEVQMLNQALEETRLRLGDLGSQSIVVQGDVSQSLARVRGQVSQLGSTLVPVANVGLNLFSKLLSLLQPVARGIASVVTTLFGAKWAGKVRDIGGVSTALGHTARAANRSTRALGRHSRALSRHSRALRHTARATRSMAKAQRDLMRFDEINRLTPKQRSPKSSSGGSGGAGRVPGGSGGGIGGGRGGLGRLRGGRGALKGISVPVSAWAKRLKKLLGEIWTPFQRAWKNKGAYVMKSARTMLDKLGRAAKSFGSTWLSVWKDGTGERLITTILTIAGKMCEVVGNLAERFQKAWEDCGNGQRIVEAVFGILQDAADCVETLVTDTAEWTKTLDLSPAMSATAGLLESFRGLAKVIEEMLADAYREVLLPLAKWTIEEAAPQLVNALANAMDLLANALKIVRPVAEAVWDSFLKPLAQWTGDTVINALQGLNTVLEGLSGMLGDIAEVVSGDGSWTDKLLGVGQVLVGGLKKGIGDALSGIGGWLKENVVDKVTAGLGSLGDGVKSVFQSALNLALTPWNSLKKTFSGFVSDVGSGLSNLGEGVKGIFKGAFDGAVNAWKGLKSDFMELAGKAVAGIQSALGGGEIRAAFSKAYTSAKDVWKGVRDRFKSYGSQVVSGLKSGLGSHVKKLFSNAYTSAKNAWSKVGARFKSLGAKAASSLKKGFSGGRVKAAFSKAYTSAKNAWGSVGSRFRSLGAKAASGLKKGFSGGKVKKAFSSAFSSACNAWSGISGKFKSFASKALSSIKSGFSSGRVKSALTAPFRAAFNAVVSLANRVVDKINSAMTFSWKAVKVAGITVVKAGSVVLAHLPHLSRLARGGVLTRATPVVAGEAGAEAVVPLERNLGWLDRMAELLSGRMRDGGGQPLVVQCVLDGRVIASSTVDYINRRARATGSNPLSACL